jgi:FkbM family methyltransferase
MEKRKVKMLNFYSRFIREDDLCFDVGANIGRYSEVLLELGARVVAIEPQPKCTDYLQEKFRNNPNFELVAQGLADKQGQLELKICDTESTVATMSNDWQRLVKESGRFAHLKWASRCNVTVTTLDALIEQFGRPRYCKIDVEGFELTVLKGLSTPIPYLSFEFTYPEMLDQVLLCLSHLNQLEMVEFNYSTRETFTLVMQDWGTEAKLRSELCNLDEQIFGDIYARISSDLRYV